jgi:hypothetical protein
MVRTITLRYLRERWTSGLAESFDQIISLVPPIANSNVPEKAPGLWKRSGMLLVGQSRSGAYLYSGLKSTCHYVCVSECRNVALEMGEERPTGL